MRSLCTSIIALASFCITGTSLGDFWGPTITEFIDEGEGYYFGHSVAIDGNTCLVGDPTAHSWLGSVYVYTSDASGTWSQAAELIGPEIPGSYSFGWSVAIDGDTCVIGNSPKDPYCMAFVYTRDSSGDWSQVAQLNGNTESWDGFGRAVAISGDTLVIGALRTSANAGSAYVYTRDASGNWSQAAEINGPAMLYSSFGEPVAIDGDTIVIGNYSANDYAGSAYVYTSDVSGNWSQVAELSGEEEGAQFGREIAIDGNTCVIGAKETNSDTGSAYVFSNSSGNWTQVAELNGQASDTYFGTNVAIDGDTCVIGAYGNASLAGAAYVYRPDAGGTWSQVAELTVSGSNGRVRSVDLDGDACVIGAFRINSSDNSIYDVGVTIYGSNAAPVEPTGACCVSSGCFVGTEAQCTESGSTWLGEDGSCDDCPESCAGDTNSDGVIDIEDLLNMLGSWGASC